MAERLSHGFQIADDDISGLDLNDVSPISSPVRPEPQSAFPATGNQSLRLLADSFKMRVYPGEEEMEATPAETSPPALCPILPHHFSPSALNFISRSQSEDRPFHSSLAREIRRGTMRRSQSVDHSLAPSTSTLTSRPAPQTVTPSRQFAFNKDQVVHFIDKKRGRTRLPGTKDYQDSLEQAYAYLEQEEEIFAEHTPDKVALLQAKIRLAFNHHFTPETTDRTAFLTNLLTRLNQYIQTHQNTADRTHRLLLNYSYMYKGKILRALGLYSEAYQAFMAIEDGYSTAWRLDLAEMIIDDGFRPETVRATALPGYLQTLLQSTTKLRNQPTRKKQNLNIDKEDYKEIRQLAHPSYSHVSDLRKRKQDLIQRLSFDNNLPATSGEPLYLSLTLQESAGDQSTASTSIIQTSVSSSPKRRRIIDPASSPARVMEGQDSLQARLASSTTSSHNAAALDLLENSHLEKLSEQDREQQIDLEQEAISVPSVKREREEELSDASKKGNGRKLVGPHLIARLTLLTLLRAIRIFGKRFILTPLLITLRIDLPFSRKSKRKRAQDQRVKLKISPR
ncbi:hypothetical protein [Candidatus Odyssella thessalonicensis]|uniref:hypothetical protein n=1 Tax=Candidatus Odyssella thessalonicensis TaxID=84647 RepID=UPI000225A8C9|nr:hypothetical protein [Candidatus Odyssella thessalonicensis]